MPVQRVVELLLSLSLNYSLSSVASSIIVMNPASTGPLPTAPTSQLLPPVATTDSNPTTPRKKCHTVACIGR